MLDSIRFSHDRPSRVSVEGTTSEERQESLLTDLLHRSVKIRPETFPRVASAIQAAESRLLGEGMPPDVFVHSDANMQACCFLPGHYDHPVILLTSSLIERLEVDELTSVIGHEIGHAVFKHNNPDHSSVEGLERLKILAASRSAEVSADRAGLLACRNLNAAVSALIKITTGLGGNDIRFDLQAFLQQFSEITEKGPSMSETMSTHPLFLLRIRALFMFANSIEYHNCIGRHGIGSQTLDEADRGIMRDIRKISGLSLEEVDDELITQILILASFAVFTADGKFSKDEQDFFKEAFGEIDASEEVKLAQQKGHSGVLYELRRRLSLLGGVSPQDEERMKTFFSVLTQTFPQDHTEPLRTTLNSLGFV
jgi:hypothetical protein